MHIKNFLLLISFALSVLAGMYLTGCTSSQEVIMTEAEKLAKQRAEDSVEFYGVLSASYEQYQNSLKDNKEGKENTSKKEFEKALSKLKKVDSKFLKDSTYINWQKDYRDLATSITSDYLTIHKDIEPGSAVFSFAEKYNVIFERQENNIDIKSEDVGIIEGSEEIKYEKNDAVNEYLEFYTNSQRGRGFVDKTLYRSGKYFPTMRKILRYHGVPEDLVFLSVQESGLNPTIVSKAGAVGLWQFMSTTGSSYGLYNDGYRDDRRDFEKSTDAAARHLKDLYRTYNDWFLAFGAYNAGPGRINSAMSKANSNNFWDIRSYLPGETKNYVPSIIALSYIFRSPSQYGFNNVEYAAPLEFDRMNIKGTLALDKIAEFCDSDIETIRELNPELLTDSIPNYDVPYQIRIPRGTFDKFLKRYKNSEEFAANGMQTPEFAGNENKLYEETIDSYVTYKVVNYNPPDIKSIGFPDNKMKIDILYRRPRELTSIADSFNVRPVDIRLWNNIPPGTYPKDSSIISVYLSENDFNKFFGITKIEEKTADTLSANNADTLSAVIKEANKPLIIKKENNTDIPIKKKITGKESVYIVKEGDSLGQIAADCGVTVSDLREWNNIQGDKILVGQKLKLYGAKIPDKNKNEKVTTYVVQEGDNLSSIADNFGVSLQNLKDWNELESDVIYPGQELTLVKPKTATQKEKVTVKDKGAKTHKVKEGENLTLIADKYGVSTDNLIDWNSLESDVIKVGQVLIVSEPQKKVKEKKGNKITHKVISGETLSSIADDYGVTIDDIKEWNSLKSDIIKVGESLTIYSKNTVKEKSTTKEKTAKKTKSYTVKKGDTLQSIADKFDVTIKQLKKWNNMKSDVVKIGEVLKVSE